MIRINLLNSVTERQTNAVNTVEKKVSNPLSKMLLMAVAVFVMTTAVIGWDVISSSQARASAEKTLGEEKKKAQELEKVMKEQKDLETKIKNIDLRIEAIKKLRDQQAGPSAVLKAVSERIVMQPGIFLDSIDQKGEQLTIKGSSRNEDAVTQFGRSLEFSSGLFTNLSIETQRREIQTQQAAASDGEIPKIEVIDFTIRTSYSADKGKKKEGDGETMTAENKAPQAPGAPNNGPATAKEAPKVSNN